MDIIFGNGQQINVASGVIPVSGPDDNRVIAVDNTVVVGWRIANGANRNSGSAGIVT